MIKSWFINVLIYNKEYDFKNFVFMHIYLTLYDLGELINSVEISFKKGTPALALKSLARHCL